MWTLEVRNETVRYWTKGSWIVQGTPTEANPEIIRVIHPTGEQQSFNGENACFFEEHRPGFAGEAARQALTWYQQIRQEQNGQAELLKRCLAEMSLLQ